MAAAKPPRGLDTAGRALWRSAVAEFTFNSVELAQLRQVAKMADDIAAIETELSTMGVIVSGSKGQPVANPLFRELRNHRRLFDQLVAGLALPVAGEAIGKRRTPAARQTAGTPRIKLGPQVARLQRQQRDKGA